jgi:hypothetical protein
MAHARCFPTPTFHNQAIFIYSFLEIPPQAESTVVIYALSRDLVLICGGIKYFMTGNWDHDALEGGTPPPGEHMGHSFVCFLAFPALR